MGTEYLSPNEVADQLHLSRKTIYGLMRNGKLGYCKLGTGRGARVRISQQEIARFMDGNKRAAFAQKEA